MPSIDEYTDTQIAAISHLIETSLTARFGAEIVASTFTWPVTLDMGAIALPALVIARDVDSAVVGTDVDDEELVTLKVEYYVPTTPVEALGTRWPVLRAVWAHCLSRLRAGFDPLVDEGARAMASEDWDVPSPLVAQTKYLFGGGTTPVPCFQGTVQIRSSRRFDWTFGGALEHDDLGTVATEVTVDDEPGWVSTITFAEE